MSPETKIATTTAPDSPATTSQNTTTTYSRWRPSYHLIAPRGWINDPCAPGYVPATGRYHVGFQWNPKGAEWGDVVWGKAFSADLVAWDVAEVPSLERDAPYDHAGVFTGCWRPTGVEADGDDNAVTFIYTSVSRLPIHYTKPYHRGCETLSLATSRDGGQTWVKDARNPILPGPPEGVDALGWRDPYVAEWPAVAQLLKAKSPNSGDDDKKHLFGLISGGIRGQTPTTWLYKIDAADLARWEFVGPLVTPGKNFAPSRWTGDVGVNWEVTNFLSLTEETSTQDFLIFGAEGCKPPHGGAGVVPGTKRTNRAQLWLAIDPIVGEPEEPEQGAAAAQPLMKFSYGGIFDHGLYYAANGFWDPVARKHVVVGWVTEEDIPVASQVRQGWSGCLSLPRVASLVTIPHVVSSSSSPLDAITSIKVIKESNNNNTFTVQTLGVRPDPRLRKLRAAAREAKTTALGARLPLATAQWEAHARFARVGSSGSARVGLRVFHQSSPTTTTELYFCPGDETFVIERPDIYFEDDEAKAAAEKEGWSARLQDEMAPFTLFTTRGKQQEEEEESLRVHVFYDGSVLEVFVNERVAITTRVYLGDQACAGLEFFAEGGGERGGCVLEEGAVWDGLSA